MLLVDKIEAANFHVSVLEFMIVAVILKIIWGLFLLSSRVASPRLRNAYGD